MLYACRLPQMQACAQYGINTAVETCVLQGCLLVSNVSAPMAVSIDQGLANNTLYSVYLEVQDLNGCANMQAQWPLAGRHDVTGPLEGSCPHTIAAISAMCCCQLPQLLCAVVPDRPT